MVNDEIEDGEIVEDPFWGQYGTNMHVPNITDFARDIRLPWIVTCIRSDFSTTAPNLPK